MKNRSNNLAERPPGIPVQQEFPALGGRVIVRFDRQQREVAILVHEQNITDDTVACVALTRTDALALSNTLRLYARA